MNKVPFAFLLSAVCTDLDSFKNLSTRVSGLVFCCVRYAWQA